jgi:hypothetical protein
MPVIFHVLKVHRHFALHRSKHMHHMLTFTDILYPFTETKAFTITKYAKFDISSCNTLLFRK